MKEAKQITFKILEARESIYCPGPETCVDLFGSTIRIEKSLITVLIHRLHHKPVSTATVICDPLPTFSIYKFNGVQALLTNNELKYENETVKLTQIEDPEEFEKLQRELTAAELFSSNIYMRDNGEAISLTCKNNVTITTRTRAFTCTNHPTLVQQQDFPIITSGGKVEINRKTIHQEENVQKIFGKNDLKWKLTPSKKKNLFHIPNLKEEAEISEAFAPQR